MLGPKLGYLDLLEERTVAKSKQDMTDSILKLPLRPSSAGKCTRQLAFMAAEYFKTQSYEQEEPKSNVYRLLSLGAHVEAHVIEQLKLILPDYEVRFKQHPVNLGPIDEEHDVTGSIDFVLWSEQHRCVVDVKSKKDWSTGRFKTNWDDTSKKLEGMKSVKRLSDQAFSVEDLEQFLMELDDPFLEANFLQLNLYAHDVYLISQGINHCVLLQYNKNDSRLREIRFSPSKALFNKIMNKFQIAMAAGLQGKPETAPADYESQTAIACRYCRFLKPCKAMQKTAALATREKEAS